MKSLPAPATPPPIAYPPGAWVTMRCAARDSLRRPRRWGRCPLLVTLALYGLAPVGSAPAAPLEADLGDGLRYHRAPELPADLPTPPHQPSALVLDLRYAVADEAAATALEAWLKFRATPATPVLVLLNPGTAAALRSVLAAQKANPGVLTLGTAQPDFNPDIAIEATPEAERQAYDALQNGATINTLISPAVPKSRTDEAAIMRARANLPEPRVDAEEDEPPLSDDDPPAAATPAAPPIDMALKRAVQVHRALRALKRV